MRASEFISEDLRKWFKEKWVRFGPDGKIRGDCARGSESEGKPKCLPQSKAHALGKKGRASAAAKKRREDPNPERRGKAKNVATKVNEFAPSRPERDDDVPDQLLILANRWWNATDKQPQIESVLNSMGWSIAQVESEDDAVQLQHRDGTTYFISADDFDPDLYEQQLDELTFLGSECTKDCSGHRAGYNWSKARGGVDGMSPWSPSFNKGAALAKAGK